MEISPLAQNFSLPLPLYDSLCVGDAISKDGKQFSLFVGMNREHVARLRELSLDESDEALQKNTSDRKRFGEGSYEEWYAKDRTIFTLIEKETNDLAGIVWFGSKALGRKSLNYLTEAERSMDEKALDAADWHTIAYRCYPKFRGQGLMKKFVSFALEKYMEKNPGIRMWAGINTENVASDALALSLGFQPLESASDRAAHWLVMVKG